MYIQEPLNDAECLISDLEYDADDEDNSDTLMTGIVMLI